MTAETRKRHFQVQQINWDWQQPVIQDLLLKYWPERLFGDQAAASRDVRAVLALVPVPIGANVLDIGCGLGFHAVRGRSGTTGPTLRVPLSEA